MVDIKGFSSFRNGARLGREQTSYLIDVIGDPAGSEPAAE
jgi:hypothetical protein